MVSRSAKTCPGCGAKMSRQRTSFFTILVALLLIFVLYRCVVNISSVPTTPDRQTSETSSSVIPPTKESPSWTYSTSTDKLTDKPIHYAHFIAKTGVIYNVQAWVRCKTDNKALDIFFEVGDFIGSGDVRSGGIKVEYRFDNGDVKVTEFNASTEGKAVFVEDYDIPAFLTGMSQSHTLKLRVYDFRGTPHDAEFSLRGSSSAIAKVKNACS